MFLGMCRCTIYYTFHINKFCYTAVYNKLSNLNILLNNNVTEQVPAIFLHSDNKFPSCYFNIFLNNNYISERGCNSRKNTLMLGV